MTSKGRRSAGAGAFVLALFLSAALPTPVWAQDCIDREEQAVFEMVEGLLDGLLDFIEDWGANPTKSDCAKICKAEAKACKQWGGILVQSTAFRGTAVTRLAKAACNTADDPSTCAGMVKYGKRAAKEFTKLARADFGQVCEAKALVIACSSTCNEGAPPPATCQDLFSLGP